jgi:hypothetical protein
MNSHLRSQKMLAPRCSAMGILLWGVALSAVIGGAFCLVVSHFDHSTTELGIGVAALFMSLLLFGLSHSLRRLQLIEWRLESRTDLAMIQSRLGVT